LQSLDIAIVSSELTIPEVLFSAVRGHQFAYLVKIVVCYAYRYGMSNDCKYGVFVVSNIDITIFHSLLVKLNSCNKLPPVDIC
jgi:hypothetical protein